MLLPEKPRHACGIKKLNKTLFFLCKNLNGPGNLPELQTQPWKTSRLISYIYFYGRSSTKTNTSEPDVSRQPWWYGWCAGVPLSVLLLWPLSSLKLSRSDFTGEGTASSQLTEFTSKNLWSYLETSPQRRWRWQLNLLPGDNPEYGMSAGIRPSFVATDERARWEAVLSPRVSSEWSGRCRWCPINASGCDGGSCSPSAVHMGSSFHSRAGLWLTPPNGSMLNFVCNTSRVTRSTRGAILL